MYLPISSSSGSNGGSVGGSNGMIKSTGYYFSGKRKRVLLTVILLIFVLLFISTMYGFSSQQSIPSRDLRYNERNKLYDLQETYLKYDINSNKYQITIVSDKDKDSKSSDGKAWESVLMKGYLTRSVSNGGKDVEYSVEWDEPITLRHSLSEGFRAMELSALCFYNNKLLAFDDRTGIVGEIDNDEYIPSLVLRNGDGHNVQAFKSEWCSVKDGMLYVGTTGKEWVDDGIVTNYYPQWIKIVDRDGRISHVSWESLYQSLREKTGTSYPGYLMHEAVAFNPLNRRWYFLPRRESIEPYDDVLDEEKGSNLLMSVDENLQDLQIRRIGVSIPLDKTRGFSSLVFIPYRDEMIALKSQEYRGEIATYITAFRLDGTVLMEEQLITGIKFEGIEII